MIELSGHAWVHIHITDFSRQIQKGKRLRQRLDKPWLRKMPPTGQNRHTPDHPNLVMPGTERPSFPVLVSPCEAYLLFAKILRAFIHQRNAFQHQWCVDDKDSTPTSVPSFSTSSAGTLVNISCISSILAKHHALGGTT